MSVKPAKAIEIFYFAVTLSAFLLSRPLRLSASPLSTPPPTLTAVLPTGAYNCQATTVTIAGVNFTTTPTVTLGVMPLIDVTFVSSTTLTATVPADLPGSTYSLTVTNPDGQSTSLANAFTVLSSGDGSLGPWQATTSMTLERSHFAVVHVNSYLYALGGVSGTGDIGLDSVERARVNADGSLSLWQTTASLTMERCNFAAVHTNGYVYVLGGSGGPGSGIGSLSSVERGKFYPDGSIGSWEEMTSMTTRRGSGLAAVAVGSYLYALGADDEYNKGSVERAKINTDGSLGLWQAMTSMTTTRHHFAAVVVGSYLYAIGGQTSVGEPLSSVERAVINPDGSLSPWQTVTSMTAPRCGLGAVAANGHIYAFGGSTFTVPGVAAYDNVERSKVNPNGSLGPWEVVSTLITPRRVFTATRAGRYLFALGGETGPLGAPRIILSGVERAAILYTSYLPLVLRESSSGE